MYVWCIVPMALEELNAKNNNGQNDGRIRLDGKTKIVDRCRDAFTATQPVVSRKLSYLGNATKESFGHITSSGEETGKIHRLYLKKNALKSNRSRKTTLQAVKNNSDHAKDDTVHGKSKRSWRTTTQRTTNSDHANGGTMHSKIYFEVENCGLNLLPQRGRLRLRKVVTQQRTNYK